MYRTKILLVTNMLEMNYGEPVGILFLAAYLRREGFSVQVYDPQIYGDVNLSELEKRCKAYPFDFVGISVLTSADQSLNIVRNMATVIRRSIPRTVIGCGGVGASLRYTEFSNISEVDLVMLGEGERTIAEIAKCIEDGNRCFDNIPGVVTKNKKGYIKRDLIQNLDDLPFMARDTLDERITGLDPRMVKQFEVRIFCGRGCFGKCTFCANYSVASLCSGDICRQRSVESLVVEMEELHKKYGVNRFSFWDDNFLPVGASGIAKANKIYALFNTLSFKPVFGIQTRVDTLTEDIVDVLQKAGMQNVYLGVENINEQELRLLGKQVTPEQIRSALKILYRFGYSYNSESKYRLRIGYIAFTPYSTIRTVRENYEFIREFKIPINKLSKKLLAFHNTPIRTLIERDGLLGDNFSWRFNNPGVEQLYKAIVDITKTYSLYYDKIRHISKVCKFNNLLPNWEEIDNIKSELMRVTSHGVGEVCYYASDDLTVVDGMDDVTQNAKNRIYNVAQKYNIVQSYNNFCANNRDAIAKFEKAAYVFFD